VLHPTSHRIDSLFNREPLWYLNVSSVSTDIREYIFAMNNKEERLMGTSRNDLQLLLETLQPLATEEPTLRFLRGIASWAELYLALKLLAELRTASPVALAEELPEKQIVAACQALETLVKLVGGCLILCGKIAEVVNAIVQPQQQS